MSFILLQGHIFNEVLYVASVKGNHNKNDGKRLEPNH